MKFYEMFSCWGGKLREVAGDRQQIKDEAKMPDCGPGTERNLEQGALGASAGGHDRLDLESGRRGEGLVPQPKENSSPQIYNSICTRGQLCSYISFKDSVS